MLLLKRKRIHVICCDGDGDGDGDDDDDLCLFTIDGCMKKTYIRIRIDIVCSIVVSNFDGWIVGTWMDGWMDFLRKEKENIQIVLLYHIRSKGRSRVDEGCMVCSLLLLILICCC